MHRGGICGGQALLRAAGAFPPGVRVCADAAGLKRSRENDGARSAHGFAAKRAAGVAAKRAAAAAAKRAGEPVDAGPSIDSAPGAKKNKKAMAAAAATSVAARPDELVVVGLGNVGAEYK